jgi:hypothetical protein
VRLCLCVLTDPDISKSLNYYLVRSQELRGVMGLSLLFKPVIYEQFSFW